MREEEPMRKTEGTSGGKKIQRQRDVQTERDQRVQCCRTMRRQGLESLQLSYIPKKKKKMQLMEIRGVEGSIWHMAPKAALKV